MLNDLNNVMNGKAPVTPPLANQYDPNKTQYAESSNYQPYQSQESHTPPPAPYNPSLPPEPPTTKAPSAHEKSKSKNIILVIIILILLAIIGALAGLIFLGGKGNDSGNSEENNFVSPNFAANMNGNEAATNSPDEPSEETETTAAIETTVTVTDKEDAVTTTEIAISDVGSDYGIVVTEKDPLNMRSAANKTAEVIYKVPKGAGVDILDETGDWYYASYNDGTSTYKGYLSKEYIQLSYDVSRSGFGIVSTVHDPLSMRESASKDADIIYKVPIGAGVRILGEEGDFYYASYECIEEYELFSVSGYLSKEYVLKSLEIASFSDKKCTVNSSGVSGYDTRYVALGERKSTITNNLPNKTSAIAKHWCSSYGVLWYELWSSDGQTYYGWVDSEFLDFN